MFSCNPSPTTTTYAIEFSIPTLLRQIQTEVQTGSKHHGCLGDGAASWNLSATVTPVALFDDLSIGARLCTSALQGSTPVSDRTTDVVILSLAAAAQQPRGAEAGFALESHDWHQIWERHANAGAAEWAPQAE
ncbi:hypothetical protein HBI56_223120 [Parastagonospora nodorum]|uniref:Uncharacterized protein n=1 Tax=Phaeosphaeria nodorum (strain SN15 / ATCC MYA-4574 / FGSC 10173) TaxID=321614 RepID=A0A7U2HW38_PHANO|nr:hypothetical protein HBH56_147870 [Parastagonospora nodorum]QRC94065.1 hypothetical protein JI435_430150 [Parastagonospora nodorum SN15]KAH3923259.1 hypothetical protein HBH54_212510 [Parastagonospora nodorum]KAH3945938.1 hypothetical protein HBH53_135330 [Parastagonospora nodorum]KAH3983905.1 hypothetical protein HBH52_064710 [Parastagonospora nodorum]